MKNIFSILCILSVLPLFAAGEDAAEQIKNLERERMQKQNQLIHQRVREIKSDKRLNKLAIEILKLNQELADYLNTKPEIRKLNMELIQIDKKLEELKKDNQTGEKK